MTYVITEPCVGVCDTACVDVCPMDCIHGPIDLAGRGGEVKKMTSLAEMQLYIDPEECIDCGACEPECPVQAIFQEDDVPETWAHYIQKNAAFFLKK